MEKSESGQPIYRYENKPKDFQFPQGDPSIDEITKHIEQHIGKIDTVYHELVSDKVHIDVHWVKPTPERRFHTLVTSGMSDLPMKVPEGMEEFQYSELSICLPEEWKLAEEDLKDEKNYWPLRWLKYLARFPHEYDTWLGWGHTIPNGDPPQPFAENTQMNTMLLLPSVTFPPEFRQLSLPNKTINFFALIPLYQEEAELKLKKGAEALFDGFDKNGVMDVLRVTRPNTVRKKRFGLF